jgi:hypothetical protein
MLLFLQLANVVLGVFGPPLGTQDLDEGGASNDGTNRRPVSDGRLAANG